MPENPTPWQLPPCGRLRRNQGHLPKLFVDGGKYAGQGWLEVTVAGQRGGARGIVPCRRPRDLKQVFRHGDAVRRIIGKGSKKRPKPASVRKRCVVVPKQVPFRRLFEAMMRHEMAQRVPASDAGCHEDGDQEVIPPLHI